MARDVPRISNERFGYLGTRSLGPRDCGAGRPAGRRVRGLGRGWRSVSASARFSSAGALGRLHRMYRGVYSIADRGPDPPWALASGAAGLGSAGDPLLVIRGRPGDTTLERRRHPRRCSRAERPEPPRYQRALRPIARSWRIDDADGIRCTTVARTLLAVAARGDDRRSESRVSARRCCRIFDGREVDALLLRAPGLPGAPLLRRVHGDAREDGTKNPFEASRAPVLRAHAGWPNRRCNVWLSNRGARHRSGLPLAPAACNPRDRRQETHGTRTAFHDDRPARSAAVAQRLAADSRNLPPSRPIEPAGRSGQYSPRSPAAPARRARRGRRARRSRRPSCSRPAPARSAAPR